MGHFIILNGSLLFQVYGIYEVFIVIRNMFDLRGKTIIITGGAGHLGSGKKSKKSKGIEKNI